MTNCEDLTSKGLVSVLFAFSEEFADHTLFLCKLLEQHDEDEKHVSWHCRMDCYKCITETLNYLLSASQPHQAPSVPKLPGPPQVTDDPNRLANMEAEKHVGTSTESPTLSKFCVRNILIIIHFVMTKLYYDPINFNLNLLSKDLICSRMTQRIFEECFLFKNVFWQIWKLLSSCVRMNFKTLNSSEENYI